MQPHARTLTVLLALGLLSGCGSAVEYGGEDGSNQVAASAPDSKTMLGSFEMYFNPSTEELTLTPLSVLPRIAQGLLLSAEQDASLATSLASTDVTLGGWYTTNYDEGANALQLRNAAVTNTHSGGKHYIGLTGVFNGFKPSTVNMNTAPAHVTCNGNGCNLDYGDLPYGAAVSRTFILYDPDATAFTLNISFAATLTTTAPTAYITSIDDPWWPPSSPIDTFYIHGLGFGKTPVVKVNGTTVSYSDASDTLIELNGYALPDLSGLLTVTNGAVTITGPTIFSRTAGLLTFCSNSGDGALNGTIYMYIWTGAGTVPASGCPPTSGLGTFDTEIFGPLNILGNGALTTGNAWNFIDVTGTGLNMYIGYDKTNNGLGVDAAGKKDYYYSLTNQTVTYHSSYTYLRGSACGLTAWSLINNSNAVCN